MNTKHTILLLTLTTLAAVALAEEKKEFPKRHPERAPEGRRGNEEMRKKMMLRRFDKDGDGKLNKAEKEAAGSAKKEIMKKYDKDGDGKLNPEERKALMTARRKELGIPEHKVRKREGGGEHDMHKGARMNPEHRKMMMKKYDKDGDGKLNEEERKALMQERKNALAKFDADGDGKLTKDERKKLHEHLKAQKAE